MRDPAAVSPDADDECPDCEGSGLSDGRALCVRCGATGRIAAAPRPAGPTPEGTRGALSEKREADALKLCRKRHNPLIEAACDRCIAEVIERNPSPEPVDRVRLIESRLRAYKNYAGYGGGFDRDIEYLLAALASARAALDEKDEKYITDTTALRAIIDEQQAALSEATRREEALLAVVEAARRMPRATPAAGGAGTVHDFRIEAGVVWTLDRALTNLDVSNAARAALPEETR